LIPRTDTPWYESTQDSQKVALGEGPSRKSCSLQTIRNILCPGESRGQVNSATAQDRRVNRGLNWSAWKKVAIRCILEDNDTESNAVIAMPK